MTDAFNEDAERDMKRDVEENADLYDALAGKSDSDEGQEGEDHD